MPWTAKGFDLDALTKIAHHCFISSVRTLDGMNNVVEKFYKQGLLSAKSIDEYMLSQIELDSKIKRIIEASGRSRTVTSQDREYYRTWSVTWGFGDDIILYAAEQAVGKTYPTAFVNQLLSTYKANGVNTLESAKKFTPLQSGQKTREKTFEERTYSQEELKSVITSIDSLKDIEW